MHTNISQLELLSKFNVVALERVGSATFRLPSEVPDWLEPICHEGVTQNDTVVFKDELSFIANFLVDAESVWGAALNERLASGIYGLSRQGHGSQFVELFADHIGETPVLFVELLGVGSPGPRSGILRSARNAKLELEMALASVESTARERRDSDAFLQTLPFLNMLVSTEGKVLSLHSNDEYTTDGISEEFIGKPITDLFGQAHGGELLSQIQDACRFLKGHSFEFEDSVCSRARNNHVEINPVDQTRAALVVRNITDRVELERQLKVLAFRDSLTGLANRNLLDDRVLRAMRRADRSGRQAGILFIDLDGFKAINDKFGHQVGDAVLVAASDRLKRAVRATDSVLRLGGDEFVIVVEGAEDPLRYEAIAANVVSRLSQPLLIDGVLITISASIGISLYPTDGIEVSVLLRKADAAMYRAKESGKNRFAAATGRVSTVSATLSERVTGQLKEQPHGLRFTPIVDVSKTRVLGFSCIRAKPTQERSEGDDVVTWNSDELGIKRLVNRQAFAHVVRLLRGWQRANSTPLKLSIEVERAWLSHRSFVTDVVSVCDAADIRAELIEFVCEEPRSDSIYADQFVERTCALAEHGFLIALASIGSVGTNIKFWRRLRLHSLRLDPALVRTSSHSEPERLLAQFIAQFAKSTQLAAVATGVETQKECLLLRELGFDRMEGPLFSPHLEESEIPKFLETWTANQKS